MKIAGGRGYHGVGGSGLGPSASSAFSFGASPAFKLNQHPCLHSKPPFIQSRLKSLWLLVPFAGWAPDVLGGPALLLKLSMGPKGKVFLYVAHVPLAVCLPPRRWEDLWSEQSRSCQPMSPMVKLNARTDPSLTYESELVTEVAVFFFNYKSCLFCPAVKHQQTFQKSSDVPNSADLQASK